LLFDIDSAQVAINGINSRRDQWVALSACAAAGRWPWTKGSSGSALPAFRPFASEGDQHTSTESHRPKVNT